MDATAERKCDFFLIHKKRHSPPRIVFLIAGMILALLGCCIIDYFNIPFHFGIIVENLNMDFWSILVEAFLVVLGILTAYHLVDKRQIEKDKDATKNAYRFMLTDYESCMTIVKELEKTDTRNRISKRVDFDSYEMSPVQRTLMSNNFVSYDTIVECSCNGVISEDSLKEYLEIRAKFHTFVTTVIVFFDEDSIVISQSNKLKKLLNEAIKKCQTFIDQDGGKP